jgi:hypothetical protein
MSLLSSKNDTNIFHHYRILSVFIGCRMFKNVDWGSLKNHKKKLAEIWAPFWAQKTVDT